ncbi:MAG: hypothetical protein V5A44_03645 [Haloarculaceae archaeon]
MSDVDVRAVGLGVFLLGVGTTLIFGRDAVGTAVAVALVALGAFGVAAAGLLSHAGEGRRPV